MRCMILVASNGCPCEQQIKSGGAGSETAICVFAAITGEAFIKTAHPFKACPADGASQ